MTQNGHPERSLECRDRAGGGDAAAAAQPAPCQNALVFKELQRAPDRVTRDIQLRRQLLHARKLITPSPQLDTLAQVRGDPLRQGCSRDGTHAPTCSLNGLVVERFNLPFSPFADFMALTMLGCALVLVSHAPSQPIPIVAIRRTAPQLRKPSRTHDPDARPTKAHLRIHGFSTAHRSCQHLLPVPPNRRFHGFNPLLAGT